MLFFVMGGPLPEGHPVIRATDYASTYDVYYNPKIQQAYNNSDWYGIGDIFEDSLRFEPGEVLEMGKMHAANNKNEIELARLYSEVHRQYALALRNVGKTDSADLQEQRALELLRAAGDQDSTAK